MRTLTKAQWAKYMKRIVGMRVPAASPETKWHEVVSWWGQRACARCGLEGEALEQPCNVRPV